QFHSNLDNGKIGMSLSITMLIKLTFQRIFHQRCYLHHLQKSQSNQPKREFKKWYHLSNLPPWYLQFHHFVLPMKTHLFQPYRSIKDHHPKGESKLLRILDQESFINNLWNRNFPKWLII